MKTLPRSDAEHVTPFEATALGRSWLEYYRHGASQYLTSHLAPGTFIPSSRRPR